MIRGRKRQNYFPDFGDLLRGLLIEIDGAVGHSGDEKWDRDDRRQNDLVRGFRVLRFHARTVLADPDAVARQIITVLNSMRVRPATFTHAGATVTVTGRSATLAF